jgi:hypothetical protein
MVTKDTIVAQHPRFEGGDRVQPLTPSSTTAARSCSKNADHPISIKAKAAAKDFFLGRPVDVIEGHGSDPGPDEFEFNFAIAFDTKNGLIFSFVWNLQD